jgi:hypothetical protein
MLMDRFFRISKKLIAIFIKTSYILSTRRKLYRLILFLALWEKKKSLFRLPFITNATIRRYRVNEKSNILVFDIVGKSFFIPGSA